MKRGRSKWSLIASLLRRQSTKECKARRIERPDPEIGKTKWSKVGDEKLVHLIGLDLRHLHIALCLLAVSNCIPRTFRLVFFLRSGWNSGMVLKKLTTWRLGIKITYPTAGFVSGLGCFSIVGLSVWLF